MANYQLPNDVVRTFTGALASIDNAGTVVQNPGAVFAAVSSNPAVLAVAIGTDGVSVTVNATGPNTVGTTITFSESGGAAEAAFVWTVDTVDDVTPAAVSFNPLVTVTDVAQAVPSQTPGPTPVPTPVP